MFCIRAFLCSLVYSRYANKTYFLEWRTRRDGRKLYARNGEGDPPYRLWTYPRSTCTNNKLRSVSVRRQKSRCTPRNPRACRPYRAHPEARARRGFWLYLHDRGDTRPVAVHARGCAWRHATRGKARRYAAVL